MAADESTPFERPDEDAPATSPPHVWLLEGDPLETRAMRTAVAGRFEITVFTEGPPLLERLSRSALPEALILDATVEATSALAVCRAVRARHDKLALPISMVTVRGRVDLLAECLAAGANDVLDKPYESIALQARLEGLVQLSRLQRDASTTRAALHAERERLRGVVEANVIGLYFFRLDGVVYECNDAFLALIGYTRDDLRAGRIRREAIVPPEDAAVQRATRDQIDTIGRAAPREREYIRKDGTRIPVLVGGALLPGANGEGIGYAIDLSARRHAEEALANQNLVTRTIAENASLALFMVDEHRRCTFMNPAAEAMTGYTLADVKALDRPLHDIIHHTRPDGRPYPIEECGIDRAVPRRAREMGEDVFVHRDGHFYPVAFTVSPIVADGGALGTVIEVRGTSAEKAAESDRRRAEERVSILAEASALLAGALDIDTAVGAVARLVVPAFVDVCTMDLVQEDGTVRQSLIVHRDPAIAADLDDQRRRYPLDRTRHPVYQVLRTGKTYWVREVTPALLERVARDAEHLRRIHATTSRSHIVVPLIARGRVLGALGFGRQEGPPFDATDVSLAEDLGRRAGVAIDNARLFELTQQESRRAEDANRAKDLFLSTLSHELRTPLNAIIGWTRMLKTGRLAEEKRERALDTIDRNARNQVTLIEDILDSSRIASGKLHIDLVPLAIAKVVETALDTVRPTAESKSVRLDAHIDPDAGTVHGDATRLQQVVWNLLSNAVKFTPGGGIVEVRVSRSESTVDIVVRDSGQGIDRTFLPYVFEPFRQQDASTTRQHGGLGLGLSIVKRLVEMHGGTIHADSDGAGTGATFVVRLPTDAASTLSEPPARPAVVVRDALDLECPPELDGLHVLVVDDELDARELIESLLDHCNARVTTADSATAALEKLRASPFDVLVSDIGMPGEDGYSLIAKVRSLPADRGGRIPAVAVTAYASAADRRRALMAGFQAHAVKPIEPQELVLVIANLARAKRA